MGDKRKQKKTTKKTNWENIRSWVGAVLCIAVIVAVAAYVAKLVPSSSAYTPGPVDVKPANGTPITPNPANITFGDPIQLTGNLTDLWEWEYHFKDNRERVLDADGDYVLFRMELTESHQFKLFILNWKTKILQEIGTQFGVLTSYTWDNAYISGNYVVFENSCNIFLYKISTKEIIAVTNDSVIDPGSCPNSEPDVHNNQVVWNRHAGEEFGLWLYEINSKQNKRIGDLDGRPHIFENYVFSGWFFHDLKNGTKKKIAPAGIGFWRIEQSRIYRNRVVWSQARGEDLLTYLYEIDTQQTTLLASSSDTFYFGDMWEHFSAGISKGDTPWDISLIDLTNSKIITAFNNFYNLWGTTVINGKEYIFDYYLPPYNFQIFFSGIRRFGVPNYYPDVYMIKGVIH